MSKFTRRQFLYGAGGFTLALPFLPSLLPKSASAQNMNLPKRFVTLATNHGGIWNPNMFPNMGSLTNRQMYAGHEIRSGALQVAVNGGRASLSPVLTADSSQLTQAIADKMMIIQGVDVPWYIAHHTGGHLGNYGRNDGNDSTLPVHEFRPTIDQVLAWSDTFYPDLSTVLERSMTLGRGRLSYGYSNPSQQSGDVQEVQAESNSLAMFNRIFVPEEEETSPRPPVVDRVLENYNRLRNGNRRLSANDRRRLDEHIDRIAELQRKLNAIVECGEIEIPTMSSNDVRNGNASYSFDPDSMRQYWQLQNDVIAAAFACGTCRVATMYCGDTFSSFQGDWHQDVAHKSGAAMGAEQQIIADAHQRFFEGVFMDLVTKLDFEEAPGVSALDNTLVMWSQESGNYTHHSFSIPLICAGSAGGYFRTGQYVDYRNLGKIKTSNDNPGEDMNPGLIHNQWLSNVLQSMGLPVSEFDRDGNGGYGVFFTQPEDNWYAQVDFWPNSVQSILGDPMPLIT